MASRPSRVTRSSTASAAPSAPLTRPRKQPEATTPTPEPRTTRARITRNSSLASNGVKPMQSSVRANAPVVVGSKPSRSSAVKSTRPSTVRSRSTARPSSRAGNSEFDVYDPSREPLRTFLRMRPNRELNKFGTEYISVLSNTEVLMIPPSDHRHHLAFSNLDSETAALYKFTGVFPSPVPHSGDQTPTPKPILEDPPSQAEFFKATTLPLVEDFIKGENCLLFAYGPTGSGKTFTVQGGQGSDAGLLPRVIDVVSRSLLSVGVNTKASTGLGIASNSAPTLGNEDRPMAVNVDPGYEYSVWVSYCEVYNEKIYDLLESPTATPAPSNSSVTSQSSSSSMFGKAYAALKGLSTVKRNTLALKTDKPGTTGKHIQGMQEVKISNAEDAHRIVEKGQQNRRVFSTLANRVSSRSHSIFTLKIIRVPKGNANDDDTIISKFSIVDLAGSERVVNTGTTGDRLKEAGNINKSLMVLGQCMDTLRKNQERERGKKPAIVPFRHSKLTEMFQSFFMGEGKAVMVVNINPHDTSFDENLQTMKFSAVAKGVMTLRSPTPKLPTPAITPIPEHRVVRMSLTTGGEEQDIIYEEEAEESDDDEDQDIFVDALLEEMAQLRLELYHSRVQAALKEAEARCVLVEEYEKKLNDLGDHYEERLKQQAGDLERLFNAKLEMLARAQAELEAETEEDQSGCLDESSRDYHDFGSGQESFVSQATDESVEDSILGNKQSIGYDSNQSSTAVGVDESFGSSDEKKRGSGLSEHEGSNEYTPSEVTIFEEDEITKSGKDVFQQPTVRVSLGKKPKRKLGVEVRDVEILDRIANVY